MREEGYVGSQTSSDEGETSKKNVTIEMTQSMYGEKFRKTLRLSSDQIVSLITYSAYKIILASQCFITLYIF